MERDKNDQSVGNEPEPADVLPPELAEYSHADVSVFRLPGLKQVRTAYERTFHEEVLADLEDFDGLVSIPEATKERIRPRIARSIAQVHAYQAWLPLITGAIEHSITVIVVLLAALISALVLLQGDTVTGSWGIVVFVVLVVFILFWIVAAYALDPIIGKISNSGWVYAGCYLTFIIATFLLVRESMSLDLQPLPRMVQHGFIVGSVSGAVSLATFIFLYICGLSLYAITQVLKIRRYPEEEIVQTLCYMLARAEKESEEWAGKGFKRDLVSNLEWIARRTERDLYRTLSTKDDDADVWLRECTRGMAASVRQLKRGVLLSQGDADKKSFTQSLAERLVNAADGKWGLFERAEGHIVRSRRSRLMHALRTALAILFPLLVIAGVAFVPNSLSDVVKDSIITAAIGWGAINVLTWLDPKGEERLSAGLSLTDRFTSGNR